MTKFGLHFKGSHGKLCDDNRYGDQLEYYYSNTMKRDGGLDLSGSGGVAQSGLMLDAF